MLSTLRRDVWAEAYSGNAVNVYRRGLQRAYLEAVDRALNPPPPSATPSPFGGAPQPPVTNSDVRPALRGELLELERVANAAASRSGDAMSRLHWRDVGFEVDRILRGERAARR
jgi:hypothetical protein